MASGAYVLVFVAGLIAAFGTSLGAVPLFWLEDISDRLDVSLWGFAGGLMASASVFGLLYEAYLHDSPLWEVAFGFVVGILLVIGAHSLVERFEDYEPEEMATADFQTMVSILIVLFVHSFPEGIAIGISFGELNAIGAGHGFRIFGFAVPFVAVVLTLSLAIHNIPEGVATAIPMRGTVSNVRMWGAAFFTSIPQPIGAVIAFYFIRIFEQLLGFGYGLSAGAMLYLVAADVIPDGLESGGDLPNGGRGYLTAGLALGFVSMIPLLFIL